MNKIEVYRIIDELRESGTSDKLIQDRLTNYLEANIDEFIECYEEECKHNKAYMFHENAPLYCPDCDTYIK